MNTPIFGSIQVLSLFSFQLQIFAEKNTEDRSTTTLLFRSVLWLVILLMYICSFSVFVITGFVSLCIVVEFLIKMNRVAVSSEEDDGNGDEDKSPEEEDHTPIHSSSSYRLFTKLSSKKFTGGYSFGSIELPNQLLISGNKHAMILIELYEAASKGRDLYVGHCEVGTRSRYDM